MAGSPVVKILPQENIKVRFFVSQKTLPKIQISDEIKIKCDGCEKPILAKVNFISSNAEFTPPVIYSVESREKLVFMVEAKPVAYASELHIGLPISIDLGK